MNQTRKRWRDQLFQDWHRYSEGTRTWKRVIGRLFFDAGFLAVFLLRLAGALHRRGWRILARIVHRANMIVSSAELAAQADVGPGLYLPHPYGVTIGTGCRLDRDVTLFQGVVLGAATVKGEQGDPTSAYPRIGAGVIIYPHAIVYGDIRIGDDAVILGNSVVNRDLESGGVYAGAPAVAIRGRPDARAAEQANALSREDTGADRS